MKKILIASVLLISMFVNLIALTSCVGPGLSEYSFKIVDGRYEILLVARDIRFIQKKMKDGTAHHSDTEDRISYFAYNDKYIFLQISDGSNCEGKMDSDSGLVGATYIKYLVVDLDSDEYMYFNSLDELKEAVDNEHYIDFKKWIRPGDFYDLWYVKYDNGNVPYEEIFS
mgnify:FL=1